MQLMVEGLYALTLLEDDNDRRNDLFKKFTEVVVDNSYHLQPG